MSTAGLPTYVNWDGQQAFAQPGLATGVRLFTFVLPAHRRALKLLCDQYLNDPSGGRVQIEPFGRRILLNFAVIARLQSMVDPDKSMGWLPEIDMCICVPARVIRPPHLPGQGLAWFVPYILVDNAWACISGREIYGFPKGIGWFEVPRAYGDPFRLTASTLVFKTFDATQPGTIKPLVSVRRMDKNDFDGPVHPTSSLAAAFGDILAAVGATDIGIDVKDLSPFEDKHRGLHARFVFLKEFRDISDPTLACYQAVTRANLRPRNLVLHGPLPGRYQVNLSDFASHKIIANLGLAGTTLRPVITFYSEYDFIFDVGAVF
jgi:hypothetical protein